MHVMQHFIFITITTIGSAALFVKIIIIGYRFTSKSSFLFTPFSCFNIFVYKTFPTFDMLLHEASCNSSTILKKIPVPQDSSRRKPSPLAPTTHHATVIHILFPCIHGIQKVVLCGGLK